MKAIKIIIEKSKDYFWAFAEGNDAITGGGETVAACKKDVLDCIATLKTMNKKSKEKYADGSYKLIYKFDTESLLNYYKNVFSAPALSKLTGINEKQIHHYATGLKKPRAAQKEKIEIALHKLGAELLAVEL